MPSYAEVSGRYVPPRDLTNIYMDVIAPKIQPAPPFQPSPQPRGFVEPGLELKTKPYSAEHAALGSWRI